MIFEEYAGSIDIPGINSSDIVYQFKKLKEEIMSACGVFESAMSSRTPIR
ncbi:hypothetical protein BZL35_00187 [Candidatus Pandoraea novymonadis]|uniref:Uncharacterized protein n=1 Tax=Candidatus Pandoraea novymonadis TaxID=1808959 RepID=A0ABX5FE44_9BURK|nr:hypothetical protein BZL35_00187 [Candidatus Pandoraea novymonadis]